MPTNESIVIRLTGDSGDGMQLVGEQLTITAALSGKDVRTLPDYPAEIRAPAGTVGGVSGFQVALSARKIFTAGESLDVLVALNPAALKHSLGDLAHGGLLILNEDSFKPKDWEKAGISPQYLENVAEHYHILQFPLLTQTLAAVADIALNHNQQKKTKNFYVLGLVLWLFDLPLTHCRSFIAQKFAASPEVAAANDASLRAGYNYGVTLELSRKHFHLGQVARDSGEYRQITGIEAVSLALASLAVGTKTEVFVSGYPITPASALLHECAKLGAYGVNLLQAEDEIAAICACLGAAYGGKLALTCTSGPGMDLKAEGIGLGVMTELPVVILDVQRAGASTGLPTKTGQSDLQQALYGRHGESPIPVLAPKSPTDCFYCIFEAFRMAIHAITPVIVMMDAYLANAAEPFRIPDPEKLPYPTWQYNRSEAPFARDDVGARSWNLPGSAGFIYQLGGLEKQGERGRVSYDAENHAHMVHVRAQKIANLAKSYAPIVIEGCADAPVLLISWGSTYGSVRSAVERCAASDVDIAYLHLQHLSPLPQDLGRVLRNYRQVLVAELNSGHLCRMLRAEYLVDARSIQQINGQPFTVSILVERIMAEVTHVYSL